jgi:hypothetical protein
MNRRFLALALATVALAACGGPNKNEREADKITRAVIANDMRPVIDDFDPSVKPKITRVKVAQLSDELSAQGAYKGLKENDQGCDPGYVCFDVQFDQRPYRERMQIGSDGKVRDWWIHAAK